MLRLAPWLLALALFSCKNAPPAEPGPHSPVATGPTETSPTPVDPGPAPDATPDTPPAPASYSCTSDDDCLVSCELEDRCCGKLCVCDIPYHRDQLARILEDHRQRCDHPCPVARCVKPDQATAARCVDGTCTAVKVPWETP